MAENRQEQIAQESAAAAEATVYSMSNSYLSDREKALVELVYQFPIGMFGYAFVLAAMLGEYSFWEAFGVASAVSLVCWFAARFGPPKWFWALGALTAGWIVTIAQLGLAAWAYFGDRALIAAFTAACAFGLGSIGSVGMWMWAVTSTKMNAKYKIAKRAFGVQFPFEKDL